MKKVAKKNILTFFLFTILILMAIALPLSKNSYSLGFRERVKEILTNEKDVQGKEYKKKFFAFEYHQSSKHTYLNVLTSWRPDWFNKPDVSKIYPGAKTIRLKKDLESWKGLNFEEVIKKSEKEEDFSSPQPLSIDDVSRLLYFAYGVSGVTKTPGGILYLRTAPSAGALYPTEIYLAVDNVKDLESGIYNYLVKDHILQLIKKGDFTKELISCCLDDSSVLKSNLIFVFTDIFYRSKWKYRERGYRYSLIDTGYVIQNLTLEAASMGLKGRIYIDFLDDRVNKLLGLDGIKEASVALVAIGRGINENRVRRPDSTRGRCRSPDLPIWAFSKDDLFIPEFKGSMSISEKYHESSKQIIYKAKMDRIFRKPYSIEKRIILSKKFSKSSITLEQVLIKRRSSENFSSSPMSKAELSEILYFCSGSQVIDLFLIVNNVQGLEKGVYHYDLENHAIELIKKIDLQGVLWKYCLRQDIVKGASVVFVKVGLIDQAVKEYGDRGYRHILLTSGIMGEDIYLVATKLKLGVRAIGAFFDDELNNLVEIDSNKEAVIHVTIVGKL